MLLLCMNIFRSFDARRECSIRRYSYLLPAEVIGINNNLTSEEINHHLSGFNRILNAFEVISISVNDPSNYCSLLALHLLRDFSCFV